MEQLRGLHIIYISGLRIPNALSQECKDHTPHKIKNKLEILSKILKQIVGNHWPGT
jgi:hypothetical protein